MTRSTVHVLAALVAVSSIVIGCSSSNSHGGTNSIEPDAATDAGTTTDGVLDKLGVTSTPKQWYVNSQGKKFTPNSGWQPMRKPATVFYPSSEVFVAGTSYQTGTDYNLLFDDLAIGASTPTLLSTPFTDDQADLKSRTKASVAADINGDGIQDIILFTVAGTPALYAETSTTTTAVTIDNSQNREIDFFVYQHGTDASSDAGSGAISFGPVNSAITYPSNEDFVAVQNGGVEGHVWAPLFSVTKGDIDGDGIDEIFLTVVKTVYILKMPTTASQTLTTVGTLAFDTEVTSVATGDADGDGKDEFVVCERYNQCVFYDGYHAGDTNKTGLWYYTNTDTSVLMLATAFGDFDHDGVDEFVIARASNPVGCGATAKASIYKVDVTAIDESSGLATGLAIRDPLTTALTTDGSASSAMTCGNQDSFDSWPLLVRALDLDGDGTDELFMHNTFFMNVLTAPTTLLLKDVFDNPNDTETILDAQVGVVDDSSINAALGSSIQRPKENLVVLSLSQAGTWYDILKMQAIGLDTSSKDKYALTSVMKYLTTANNLNDTSIATKAQGYISYTQHSLAVGNFDDDSRRMIATGHELTYSDPLVIAVLSSAPYWQSIADVDSTYTANYPLWPTTYGTSTAHGNDLSQGVGMTIGFGFGFETELEIFGIKIDSFKATAEFETKTSVEWRNSWELKNTITYTAGGGEDRVIFTAIPLDKYSYEVLYSPTQSEIGKTLSFSIPRQYSTYSMPLGEFNSVTGLNIPTSHTLGQPFSYPTFATASSLLNQYKSALVSIAMNVVAGGTAQVPGPTQVLIEVSNTTAFTFSLDESETFSEEASAGGFIQMGKLGFNQSFSYGQSTTNTTAFSGTVGYLPDAYYNDGIHSYSAELFVYPYPDPFAGRTYLVVDYAVDPN